MIRSSSRTTLTGGFKRLQEGLGRFKRIDKDLLFIVLNIPIEPHTPLLKGVWGSSFSHQVVVGGDPV